MPTLTINKISRSSFEEIESWEAGLALMGNEVRSIKNGMMKLKGAYITIMGTEAWLVGAHIPAYQNQLVDYDPDRRRKLLLRKKEINSLIGHTKSRGLTILPTKVYTKGGLIKVKIALMRGKKVHEKREVLKKRDVDRSIQRALRQK